MRDRFERLDQRRRPPKVGLTILFIFVNFITFSITMFIMGSISFILIKSGSFDHMITNRFIGIITFTLSSILMGTIVSNFVGRIPLRPFYKLIDAMNQLASGNFDVKLDLGKNHIVADVANSFNKMADELKNTEMLRSDFVNNFSHEFKTPIVSIRGFAKLLQKSDLTDTQREYVEIIVDESNRLADMATNVLNLTKIENQSILSDMTSFNLSEQMRNSILLLENKWMSKSLMINADFDEIQISANEELLKQVWINIIDNAIKFSSENNEIDIKILEIDNQIQVSIKNQGVQISDEDKKRIFNKYWQADTSHASQGTGIGLSIAKRIVELHRGNIEVISALYETTFLINLPKETN